MRITVKWTDKDNKKRQEVIDATTNHNFNLQQRVMEILFSKDVDEVKIQRPYDQWLDRK